MASDHAQRNAAQPWRRWYWTNRWRRRSTQQLADEPLCRNCARHGRVTPATVADHVVPHRGDPTLFWEGELQSLCDAKPWRCHSSVKQREEARGYVVGCDLTGRPLASDHPWNRVKQ